MLPRETITRFDTFLYKQRLRLEAVVVGGAALSLLGVIDRQTRDVDVLHPGIPKQVKSAATVFAQWERTVGNHLADNWLNNGPSQLKDILPLGWELRLRPVFAGVALMLRTLGRSDLLKTKLFALCDRGIDLQDCIALHPSQEELADARAWLLLQDANPGWPDHVYSTVDDMRKRLGHGF